MIETKASYQIKNLMKLSFYHCNWPFHVCPKYHHLSLVILSMYFELWDLYCRLFDKLILIPMGYQASPKNYVLYMLIGSKCSCTEKFTNCPQMMFRHDNCMSYESLVIPLSISMLCLLLSIDRSVILFIDY
jgi:hypothetical protein